MRKFWISTIIIVYILVTYCVFIELGQRNGIVTVIAVLILFILQNLVTSDKLRIGFHVPGYCINPCGPFLLIIAFSLLLSSCVYHSMANFTEEDLLWLKAYQQGERIPFRSTSDVADTLSVHSVNISNETCPIYCNPNLREPYAYQAHGNIGFTIDGIQQESRIPALIGYLSCRRLSPDSLSIYVEFIDFLCYCKIIDTLETRSINGRTYPDCLVLDLDDKDCYQVRNETVDAMSRHSVTGLVWSRSSGLLQYTLDSTEVYTVAY